MSIKKQYLKTRPVCRATFRIPQEAAKEARTVNIVGEFNEWNIYKTPMKKLKNGSFTAIVDLAPNREYQFRYLVDETAWDNDWHADKYVFSTYGGCENSVVTT